MVKTVFRTGLWIVAMVFVYQVLLSSVVFASGGGGGGGEGLSSPDIGVSGPLSFEGENIEPGFRTPDFVKKDPPRKDVWATRKKPSHWTNKQWREFLSKKDRMNRHRQGEANAEKDRANRNDVIARGTGYVATGAGAVVGVVAAPAVLPTIVVISVVGDGAAATAGSLAEGKSAGEAIKTGVKKSVSSAILSKVSTGKKTVDVVIGFAGSVGYDNIESSDKELPDQMPSPDFTTPGGHSIYK